MHAIPTQLRRRQSRPRRLTSLALLTGLLVALVVPAASAQAGTAYRYWGYYQFANGAWAFAQKGPDQLTPKDGAIEGWRFAVTEESSTRFPRLTPDFAAICKDPAPAGKKRVAVVIDFGRVADSTDGTTTPPAAKTGCAVVDETATGAQVLAAVATVRVSGGLTCGLDGYPATGCGDPVKDVTAAMKAADEPITAATTPATDPATPKATTTSAAPKSVDDASNMSSVILSVVAILAMGALALTIARRNKATGTGNPDA